MAAYQDLAKEYVFAEDKAIRRSIAATAAARKSIDICKSLTKY
jgi:hypothetical protein